MAAPLVCSSYAPAVQQNCYFSAAGVPLPSLTNSANRYATRYDCAVALGYYLPCLVSAANSSYQALYAALAATPCLVGRPPVLLVNHSRSLTVVEVDSSGAAGLLSSYKHDNSSLSGNVGSCAGSLTATAAAGVSYSGAACCAIDPSLQPIASAALSTLQAGLGKLNYTIIPRNAPVPPNGYQLTQQAVAALSCPPLLPASPGAVRCISAASLIPLASAVNQYCYFNPLWPIGPTSSATASLGRVSCAVPYTAFALCQIALNNASLQALTAAEARSTRARNATVTAAAGTGLSSCCTTGNVPSTAVLLQVAYNTVTGLGGNST